jgi:hypothetical protein
VISGNFATGKLIPLSGNEEIVLGSQYEFRGAIPWEIMAALPDSWVQAGIEEIFSIEHSELDVLGVELNEDGSFRIRVVAKHNSPVLLLAAAVLVGLAILAGMKIEQMYQVVFGSSSGSRGGVLDTLENTSFLLVLVGVGVGVWFLWSGRKALPS